VANSKKHLYFLEAENLFVTEGMSLIQISKKIPLSSRMLQDWAKLGRWVEKRKDFVDTTTSSHADTHRLYQKLVKRMLLRLDDEKVKFTDEEVKNEARLMQIAASMLGKVKAYEEESSHSNSKETSNAGELTAKLNETLSRLGIRNEPFGEAHFKNQPFGEAHFKNQPFGESHLKSGEEAV
jgi:hypothetical protein